MLRRIAVTAACLFLSLVPAAAQDSRGSITGKVTDPQGGLIPAAQIAIVNTERNETHTTVTNGTGYYEINALMPGMYRVTDVTGASVVGAAVNAKDLDRGSKWNTVTNDEGVYAFPRIPNGRYSLKIEAAGFKASLHPEIALEVNQRGRSSCDDPMTADRLGGAFSLPPFHAIRSMQSFDSTQGGTV